MSRGSNEGDQKAGGKVKGDGGRCHWKRFSGSQGAERKNQGQIQNIDTNDITC
jgi:hypothetical protein